MLSDWQASISVVVSFLSHSDKKLWQRYCRSFFSLVYRAKSAKSITDFQSVFYRDGQLLPGGWIFCCPLFLLFSECSISPQPETVEWFMPSCKIRNWAQNYSGHLQSGRKTGIIATVTCLSSSAG